MQIVTNLHIPSRVKSIQNYRRQMKAETQQTKITFLGRFFIHCDKMKVFKFSRQLYILLPNFFYFLLAKNCNCIPSKNGKGLMKICDFCLLFLRFLAASIVLDRFYTLRNVKICHDFHDSSNGLLKNLKYFYWKGVLNLTNMFKKWNKNRKIKLIIA